MSKTFFFGTLIASLSFSAAGQSQPGRFLASPSSTITECNIDGSNCLNVVRSGGDVNPAGVADPSIANNGTIAFAAYAGPDGSESTGAQGVGVRQVFFMNADGTNV